MNSFSKRWLILSFLGELAFLTDITNHLNILNKSLQGTNQDVCHLYTAIAGFQRKLSLLAEQFERGDFFHFPACQEIHAELGDSVDFSAYQPHLDVLISNFELRFHDFAELQPSLMLFSNPRTIDISTVERRYQMELCELQADPFLTQRTETGAEFFKLLSKEQFPLLRNFELRILSMFGSTYRCEQAFSNMNLIKSKTRNNLADNSLESCLRMSTTKLKADIDQLVKNFQAQTSH